MSFEVHACWVVKREGGGEGRREGGGEAGGCSA